MSITMIPQPSGMVLPKCSICGKDIFCRNILSIQELIAHPNDGIEVKPVGLGYDLVGQGLSGDNLTCSACLPVSGLNRAP